MTWRSPLFKVLLGGVLLLVLSVWFLRSTPSPSSVTRTQPDSRELDEAAEEVRAVATGMRRLEARIQEQQEFGQTLQEGLSRMERRLDQLATHAPESEASPPESSLSEPPDAASDPEAFDLTSLRHEDVIPEPRTTDLPTTALTWIDSIQSQTARALNSVKVLQSPEQQKELRFVIPPSILAGVSLTSLVGRIPRGGSVQDPWPFVVVSKAENFTANGKRLPHLRGILWRGVVHGDATLSCVSASIRSLVYVFDDGVFHSVDAPEQEGLGYLADKSGNPCLSGEMHTSAPDNLLRHVAAGVIAGAGGAYAENQVTRNVSQGTETSSVQDGEAFQYLLGQTVNSAAIASADYLARHANDSWDAVLVEAGREVDIHITASIPIHYSPGQTLHDRSIFAVATPDGGLD